MRCGVLRVNLRKDGSLFHQSLLSHLGKGSESKERLQQGVCTIAGNECGKLIVEERRVSGDPKLAYLFFSWSICFSDRFGQQVLREYLLGLKSE